MGGSQGVSVSSGGSLWVRGSLWGLCEFRGVPVGLGVPVGSLWVPGAPGGSLWGRSGLSLSPPPGTKHKTLVEARSGLGPIRAFPRGGGSAGTPPAETPERSFHCQICNVRLNSELQLKQVRGAPGVTPNPGRDPKLTPNPSRDPKLTPNPSKDP